MIVLLTALLASLLVAPIARGALARASPTPAATPAAPRWAGAGVLELDPVAGRVVVALGDPARARHLAVLVPGVGVDLDTFDDPAHPARRPYGMALAVHQLAPDTAVIAWSMHRSNESERYRSKATLVVQSGQTGSDQNNFGLADHTPSDAPMNKHCAVSIDRLYDR